MRAALTFSDQTSAAGLVAVHAVDADVPGAPMMSGGAVGDFDNDGWQDLFVLGGGLAPDRLYINNHDGTFSDRAAEWGIDASHVGVGAAVGDYDGDGTFTRVTDTALAHDLSLVRGFTPRFTDIDGDRYPELLFVADFATSVYFANDTDGTFTELTQASGCGLETNGMGTTTGDFDRDGRIDWYVTSIHGGYFLEASGNMLYLNQGGHVFQESSSAANVNDGGWGWGTQAVDFDHDGDQDVVIFTNQGPLKLLRNDLHGSSTRWLKIFFDTDSAPGLAPRGCGTRVIAATGALSQTGYLDCGSGYLGTSEPSVHFGVGSASVVDTLRIEWADGAVTVLEDVEANQTLIVTPY